MTTRTAAALAGALCLLVLAPRSEAQCIQSGLVVNEVNAGEGGPAPKYGPYIELFNNNLETGVKLDGFELQNADASVTIELPGTDLDAQDYWVVCGTSGLPVPGCDQESADLLDLIDDGMGSVNLMAEGAVCDVYIYFGDGYPPDPTSRSQVTTGLISNGVHTASPEDFGLQCPSPGDYNVGSLDACGAVINEVDYDQGEDDDRRFIEIAFYDDRDIQCWRVTAADEDYNETTFYFPLETTADAGDYVVLCDDKSETDNCDFELSESEPQCGDGNLDFSDSGANGLALDAGGRVSFRIDSLSYNDVLDAYTEGNDEAPSDLAAAVDVGISRAPNYGDTQENDPDFILACTTPGAANADSADGCACGSASIEGNEECDDGNDADDDECTTLCLDAACGDGFVNDGVEDCDTDEDTADCDVDCTAPACGDGYFNAAAEECDPSIDDPDPYCGDDCRLAAIAKGTGCSLDSRHGTSIWMVLLGLALLARRRRVNRSQ